MSDTQLLRIIRRGLSPAKREAYDAGTPAQRDAILDAFAESFLSQGTAMVAPPEGDACRRHPAFWGTADTENGR